MITIGIFHHSYFKEIINLSLIYTSLQEIFISIFSGVEPVKDDDFIFEDFARLRLKGHDPDDTEA